jgi:ABC-2 type transport system permease protein
VRPLLYDFKRTLTSKSVIIAMLLPIIISLAIIPGILGLGGSGGQTFANTQTIMYYDSNGYHFLAYSSDQYGLPATGVSYQFNLTDPVLQRSFSGSTSANSSGYASVVINAPKDQNYTGIETTMQGQFSQGQTGFSTNAYLPNGSAVPASPGQIIALPGQQGVFNVVVDTSNASKRDLEVFYAGPFGEKPSYPIYYRVLNESLVRNGTSPPSFYNESQMTSLGTLSDYHAVFPVNLPSNDTCSYKTVSGPGGGTISLFCNLEIYIEMFTQNGTLLAVTQMSLSSLYPPPVQPIQSLPIAIAFFTQILAVFIPLIAIIGAYSSYGKDRVTGVLESVLSRPVTRKGLSLSRYLSTFLALSIAIGITVGVVDAILRYFGGSFLSAQVLLSSTGAFLVELAAFVGLVYLFSHLVRSAGLLIGLSIGLFIILDFLWGAIVFLVAVAFKVDTGSLIYAQVSTIASYFNPAQFIQLVILYITNISSFGFSVPPSSLGVSIPSLVLAGVLWIVLPLGAFLFLAIKRD